jgi:hypothetical protein
MLETVAELRICITSIPDFSFTCHLCWLLRRHLCNNIFPFRISFLSKTCHYCSHYLLIRVHNYDYEVDLQLKLSGNIFEIFAVYHQL